MIARETGVFSFLFCRGFSRFPVFWSILMKKPIMLGSLALLLALVAFVVNTTPASAHGHRMVGPYAFIVGFLNEPSYAGQMSGIDLTICQGDCRFTTKDGAQVISNPITDAEKTLKAEVLMGAAMPLSLSFVANDEVPGKYTANFIPTQEGDYTFHIFGTLASQKIDERFTSSKDGFEPVEAAQQYPAQAANSDVTALKNQLSDVQGRLSTATTVGIAGLVVAVLGVLLALGLAARMFVRRSRSAPANTETPLENLRG
jgi:hypothetical protein